MKIIKLQFALLILLLSTLSFAQSSDTSEVVKRINDKFSSITKGADSLERGEAIRKKLEMLRVKYSYIPFTVKSSDNELTGWNIVAEINSPGATQTLMIGAHYDRVTKGIGAVDNASGSIAILELLKNFKKVPLKNHNLKVAFWDLEERGLLGARDYVKSNSTELPEIYINFDVFGYGDTLWLWTEDTNSAFASTFDKTSKEQKFSAIVSNKYPPSDHLAFAPTKTQSYSFSLLNKNEIGNLTRLLNREQLKPDEFPEVIRIIHTENDNLEKVKAEDIAKALPVIEAAIRNLDIQK